MRRYTAIELTARALGVPSADQLACNKLMALQRSAFIQVDPDPES
jgi:hypothetical protein